MDTCVDSTIKIYTYLNAWNFKMDKFLFREL